MYSEFSAELDCLIMPVITEQLSQLRINTDSWNIPTELNLDPNFHTSGTIDIFTRDSRWVIGGELINTKFSNSKRCHITTIDLNQQLERFWSIEEILLHNQERLFTSQEKQREDFFLRTVKRNSDGRYIIRLPTDKSIRLGDSESIALSRDS
ncbi:hypothetical protein ALC53_07613 [Atta colombica]|uniref:Peptidase aspartic putative domain-containing protein n=1 Tax=Atta colombica TaxID=520822 RepID=A0A195BCM8_9HYME|nr:hypothetical protein ALC53_07613 [Atta colombica]